MNKKKVSIMVAVISIVFVIIGIMVIIKINEGKASITSNNQKEDLNITQDNSNSEEYSYQNEIEDKTSNEENYATDNNVPKEETDYERYLRESEKDPLEQMSEFFEGTNNKVFVYVNGEPITEKEIALKNFSLNNDYIKNYTNLNLSEEESDPVRAIIRDVVLCQEAKKLGYSVTEEDIERMKSVPNYKEDITKMAKSANMTFDKFEEVQIKSEARTQLVSDWTGVAIDKIHNGEVSIDSKEFDEKAKEYVTIIENLTEDNMKEHFTRAMELSSELLDLYKEYLVGQAKIEYVKLNLVKIQK